MKKPCLLNVPKSKDQMSCACMQARHMSPEIANAIRTEKKTKVHICAFPFFVYIYVKTQVF